MGRYDAPIGSAEADGYRDQLPGVGAFNPRAYTGAGSPGSDRSPSDAVPEMVTGLPGVGTPVMLADIAAEGSATTVVQGQADLYGPGGVDTFASTPVIDHDNLQPIGMPPLIRNQITYHPNAARP